jgi:hypothetical protein
MGFHQGRPTRGPYKEPEVVAWRPQCGASKKPQGADSGGIDDNCTQPTNETRGCNKASPGAVHHVIINWSRK